MKQKSLHTGPGVPMPSRRRFVQGLALGGTAAMLGGLVKPAWALTTRQQPHPNQPSVLSGTEFHLDIAETPVNFTGKPGLATAVNGQVPGPLLRWREGTTVTLRVTNHLRTSTSIHWHGVLVPADMDGVPGISFPGIAPSETFVYHFPVKQSGTYWYHSHTGFQEQTGLFGPLVIDPAGPDRIHADRDYVVMLNDWSNMSPERIFAILKTRGDYFNFNELTVGDFLSDTSKVGLARALALRKMWNQMRMDPRDIIDVSGYTYTYLMNGVTPVGNWTGIARPGERVRLRFINGSSDSYFDVRIPGLKLTVVAADGQDVAPVEVDEFRIATAETYDVIVTLPEDRAYTIFAESVDRTGYARGTLAPRPGMAAEIPPMDAVPTLTMVDMMGAIAAGDMAGAHGMGHGSMAGMAGALDPAGMKQAHHARTEYHNPGVDMRVNWPRTNLDDPGAGLRDNGRRVLTYADLHTLGGSLYPQPITDEIELHLDGSMERFIWSFDGVIFSKSKPVHLPYGHHLRLILCNDTMMNHPIHLHGMWSELETPDQHFQVRKQTVNVQPAQRVTYRVMANALGRWAYHCHLLYHMEAGMFREMMVA